MYLYSIDATPMFVKFNKIAVDYTQYIMPALVSTNIQNQLKLISILNHTNFLSNTKTCSTQHYVHLAITCTYL